MPIFECARCNEMTYSAFSGAGSDPCTQCGSEHRRLLEGDFAAARREVRNLAAGDHASLRYDDPATIAPFCARFLTAGVDAGERVISSVRDAVRDAVCALLGPDVELVIEWRDPNSIYGNFDADRIASMYDALIGGEDRPTRILAGVDGELVEGIPPAEIARYEVAAHRVVTTHGATAVCLYDARSLSQELLDVGARRHSLIVEDGAIRRNERFEYQAA